MALNTPLNEIQLKILLEAERRISACSISHDNSLELNELPMSQLPESLRQLTWLQRLELRNCRLEQLPIWFGELSNLYKINLLGCPILDFPISFNQSKSIRDVSLDAVTAWNLPRSATLKLDSVMQLSLGVQRGKFPTWIRQLNNLENLFLHGVQDAIPVWIGDLDRLSMLALHGSIDSLPASLRKLRHLRLLFLDKPSKLGLPDELISTNDAKRILDYYFRLSAHDASPLNEFKLVLVGRGGVGKTSLVHKLITDHFEKFEQTPGIQITPWEFEMGGQTLFARIWDFGGQEILHGTHRFFMTERAVYVVMLSGRDGHAEQDAHYWLSLVRSFAGDVPVIVLLHRWTECRFEVSIQELRRTYGAGLIFLETDSTTDLNIKEVRASIKSMAQSLPGLKSLWPAAWLKVKEELPSSEKSWLSFSDFCAFANAREVTRLDDQQALADSLHDLGLMLSYRTDPVLRDCGVLNPQWVTYAIYKVLNDPAVREVSGELTLATFAQVLSGEKASLYPINLHPYLLALMRKFLLCLPLDERGKRHLIPDLLTIEEPALGDAFPEETALAFQYSYESALPEGLLPRFIVETYVHREPQNTWRRGVVLQRAGCRALIRGDMQVRTITVRVVGPSPDVRRELLAIIREHFERIHRTYEQLAVTEFVPISGSVRPVAYALLRKLERTANPVVQVEFAEDVQLIPVKQLLDGVDLPDVPRPALVSVKRSDMRSTMEGRAPLLFISYAEPDITFFDQLRQHLILQERQGKLRVYGRALMQPGQDEDAETSAKLQEARVIVLLLSSDYFDRRECVDRELQLAMKRRDLKECVVVPVLIRACQLNGSDVGKLKSLPIDGLPISQHSDRDSAWLNVIKELVRLLD